MNLTAGQFEELVGREPKEGELEKINCHQAGSYGHMLCGFCYVHNCAMAECHCSCKLEVVVIV